MKTIFNIIIVISGILMICVILLQHQSSSLGSAFGGESNSYRSKRGIEKILFYLTIALIVIFAAGIIGTLLIK
ncbi:MAG: preprotein translocase subunit SecG [bacterium]|nr:preprotein translocase subunit SecG [bacterium]